MVMHVLMGRNALTCILSFTVHMPTIQQLAVVGYLYTVKKYIAVVG